MAEVLAPIVQQSAPITMLHTPTDAFTSSPSAQSSHHQQARSGQMARNHIYNTQNGGNGYRGTTTPISPYAFQTTPQLRQEHRSHSAPANPQLAMGSQSPAKGAMASPLALPSAVAAKQGHRPASNPSSSAESTASSSSSNNSSVNHHSKDDLAVAATSPRAHTMDTLSTSTITLSTSVPDLSLMAFDAPSKPSPDRYRRGQRRADANGGLVSSHSSPDLGTNTRSAQPSGSGMAGVAHLYKGAPQPHPKQQRLQEPVRPGHSRANSVDDMSLPRSASYSSDQAKRYRRRSLGALDANAFSEAAAATFRQHRGSASVSTTSATTSKPNTLSVAAPPRPLSVHDRQNSSESVNSSRSNASRPSSAKQEPSSARGPASSAQNRSDPRAFNVPARGSSETGKRLATRSPLSKPVSTEEEPATKNILKTGQESSARPDSPSKAVQQLAALNDKDLNKGMRSRLRRAFSFGSAQELRRASAENSAEKAKARQEKYMDEREREQDAIAAKQEAAGLGHSIYSGQGNVFASSTDNISISSTASSASIMLRKMGKGMKKGGRSLKGLFRPKSVIGVPAADGPVPEPSLAQVSRVTVEAEMEKVNVNADPHGQAGGGTSYPRLERNSLDAGSVSKADADSRKSIIGSDKERAEVLAAVKKGILKRTGTSSGTSTPEPRPMESNRSDTTVSIPSAPSTPNDGSKGNGEDYFASIPRFANSSTKSLPTPHGPARNITFSNRIQFHDVWSSTEYDRRGEVATCNRLTPILAQQIKEELNTFKMEMEVHELSKPHTHFF